MKEYFDAGYTKLYRDSTSPDEIRFFKDFSKKVLPYFNESPNEYVSSVLA
jgi:hypothetical protein